MIDMKTNINTQQHRSVERVVTSIQTKEGAGFSIRRPFPTRTLDFIDPFLLLDHMEPIELGPGQAKGAPDHPHRGFETITYILEGKMQHKDSAGNQGLLAPGDVQWMTAGSGVVHSEMPEAEFAAKGGRLHGFQIWVNLPAREKMVPPRYQDIPSNKIPVVQNEDGSVQVKVIAGNSMGANAVIDTHTPIMYLHINLKPGSKIVQSIPENFNSFAYVIDGSGHFGDSKTQAGADQLVNFKNDGGDVVIEAGAEQSLNFLLLGGVPLNEPVARYGPFVMNTKEEIVQAIQDYQTGRLGLIDF